MKLIVEFLVLVMIFLLGIFLRYLPQIKYHLPGTSDMYFHFSKIRNPAHGDEEFVYPSLFHWLFRPFLKNDGQLPEQVLSRITPFFDVVTASVSYIFLRGVFGVKITLVAILLFLITPAVVIQGITFTPRPLGLLFLVSALLCLTLPFPLNFVAIIPIALILLSHRLATQTLYFILIGLSLFDLQVGIIALLGFGLGLLLSKGEYIRILRSHIALIKYFIEKGGFPNRRHIGLLIAPTVIGFLVYVFLRLINTILSFPIIFFGFVITEATIIDPYYEHLLIIWSLVCLLFLIIWFAGAAYRFTYYAVIPFALFSAILLQSSSLFIILIAILVGGCLSLSIYFSLRYDHLKSDTVSFLRQLAKIDDCNKVLVPYQLARPVAYFTMKKFTRLNFASENRQKIAAIIAEEGITHVITNRSHLNWFPNSQLLLQITDWVLLQVSRP